MEEQDIIRFPSLETLTAQATFCVDIFDAVHANLADPDGVQSSDNITYLVATVLLRVVQRVGTEAFKGILCGVGVDDWDKLQILVCVILQCWRPDVVLDGARRIRTGNGPPCYESDYNSKNDTICNLGATKLCGNSE